MSEVHRSVRIGLRAHALCETAEARTVARAYQNDQDYGVCVCVVFLLLFFLSFFGASSALIAALKLDTDVPSPNHPPPVLGPVVSFILFASSIII